MPGKHSTPCPVLQVTVTRVIGGSMQLPLVVRFDRPFAFLVVHQPTGLALFQASSERWPCAVR